MSVKSIFYSCARWCNITSWACSASDDVTNFVLQQQLKALKARGLIKIFEDHIFDPVSTQAEKLSCAYRSLAVAEHWRQQGLQKAGNE